MPKMKITVIKRFHPKDVFDKDYVTPKGKTATECQSFKDGQEFHLDKLKMPEGFCTWAWYDLYKDLSVLYWGGNVSGWMEDGVQYTACSDGVRPVCFKLERFDE
jgi:uncharacterized repeat protein (TIGR04076 family)